MLATAPGLTADQVARFEDDGFLLLRDALDPDSLEPVRAVFEDAVETQAREWFSKGLIKDRCEGLDFPRRYGALREQLPPTYSNSWRRILVSPALYSVWQHPVLVGLARGLVGDELYASPTWNGRPRAPRQLKQTIDWHQDAHYMPDYAAGDGRVLSVWMPLVPVDERSGCLQVAPGSHKRGYRPRVTLSRNNLVGLADEEIAGFEPYSCIMNPGDVLLFGELTYHRSLDNVSDCTRWSLDVRYFDARNETLRRKSPPGGYYCFSAADPSRVEPYEAWASHYTWEGEF
jgi:hypothetical protein